MRLGQEFAGYDSRALQGMGLGYATSNRGACHLKHDTFAEDMEDQTGKGKAGPCKESQDRTAMIIYRIIEYHHSGDIRNFSILLQGSDESSVLMCRLQSCAAFG